MCRASTQRFVKEYANFKLSRYKDLQKSFPQKSETIERDCIRIREVVNGWDRGLITVDEAMKLIAEA